MGGLCGQVAWVTGGGSGIGRAAALALGSEGAHVVVSGRRRAELDETVSLMEASGSAGCAMPVDVSDMAQVTRVAAEITESIGPVTVLACCAGINIPGRFWDRLKLDDYRSVVQVNLDGVVGAVHAVLPGMRERGAGTIVVVSSWAGREFLPIAGMAYGASKAALSPLVESINCEEGRKGIRATLLMPGEVATPILMTRPVPPLPDDFARMLQPEDMGDLVRYIAVAPARMCLGEILVGPTWNRIYIGADDMKVGAR
jgi:NAD(P)-dependent dehydrogenase (short-subunit alcohol dehydrogenase family)